MVWKFYVRPDNKSVRGDRNKRNMLIPSGFKKMNVFFLNYVYIPE